MINRILKVIDQGQNFLVASHGGPDGDAIASTLALTLALRQLGKNVVAYNRDGLPADYDFLPEAQILTDTIPAEAQFDAGFILDAGELRRAGAFLRDHCTTLINIDHHPYSEDFGEIYFVDVSACATGLLVYRILRQGEIAVSLDIAKCIYAAILADTGSFRYSNANPEAFQVASDLVNIGVHPWEIAAGLYESRSEPRLRLLAKALETLSVSPCGKLASVSVTTAMYQQTGAGAEHTDGFVNYPRSLRGVEVALFFRQVSPNQYKVGFRSKGNVDVGALSRGLGGGGHHNAAGALVEGDLDSVRELVYSRIGALLK